MQMKAHTENVIIRKGMEKGEKTVKRIKNKSPSGLQQ